MIPKRVIRIRKSMKDRQHDGQKKEKRTKVPTIILKTLYRKLKIEQLDQKIPQESQITKTILGVRKPKGQNRITNIV